MPLNEDIARELGAWLDDPLVSVDEVKDLGRRILPAARLAHLLGLHVLARSLLDVLDVLRGSVELGDEVEDRLRRMP